MTVAVLLATLPIRDAESPGPVAALPATSAAGETTLLGMLHRQLDSLGVDRVVVVARPGDVERLEAIQAGPVIPSWNTGDDLRAIARIAHDYADRDSPPLVVLPADLMAHRAALAAVISDPRPGSAALVAFAHGHSRDAPVVTGGTGFATITGGVPARVDDGAVSSAASSFHRVRAPNASFLHVIRVGRRDLKPFATAADQLAALAEKESLGADVTALLLVGLVRSGANVTSRDVGALGCYRVLDPAGVESARARLSATSEESAAIATAVKSDDGLFATYCVSSYSPHIVRFVARLGIQPNAVTIASLALGFAAAATFALGGWPWLLVGAVVLQISFVADCVDGQLARYTRQFTAFGAWLDVTSDRVKEYVVYAGLAIGAASVWPLAIAAMVLQTTRHMIDFGYKSVSGGSSPSGVRPLDEPDDILSGSGEANAAVPSRPPLSRRVGNRAAALAGGLERRSSSRWVKKVIVLPIGERLALISLTAAVGGARVTFLALLIWGGIAGIYMLAGRVLRSLAASRQGLVE